MPVRLQKPADVDVLMSRAMDHCWPKCRPAIEAGCTAIAAFNDDLALVIMALAARHGIAVPDRLSVVGFDNTRHGAMAGLTSYDLNGPAVMNAMVGWVLNPRGSPAGRRKGVVVITGNLIVRESSGPAPLCVQIPAATHGADGVRKRNRSRTESRKRYSFPPG